MNKLIKSDEKTIFDDIKEPLIDIGEINLDEIFNADKYPILKELPMLKILISTIKTIVSVRDIFLTKKLIKFLNELDIGTIDKDRLIAYRSTIEKNRTESIKDARKLFLYLDSYKDEEKSILLARIYKSYINQIITREEFYEFGEIVDQLFERDLSVLNKIARDEILSKEEGFIAERLHSYGLIGTTQPFSYEGPSDYSKNIKRNLSVIGQKFIEAIE